MLKKKNPGHTYNTHKYSSFKGIFWKKNGAASIPSWGMIICAITKNVKTRNTNVPTVQTRSMLESFLRVYPGFPTLFWSLLGVFVGDLMERLCGSSWKTHSVFQGAVGAFCASTAPSAPTGPVRVRQDGSQGGGPMRDVELDRRVHGLHSTGG